MKTSDLKYIRERFKIDPATTSRREAASKLEANGIGTTSWVLDALEQKYGTAWATSYRASIETKTCEHGMFAPCYYCKWGTD